MKTIGYISQADPFHDRRAWSGTVYKIRESIERAGYRVVWIPCKVGKWKETIVKAVLKLCYGREAITNHNRWIYRAEADSLDQTLVDECDYLFFPGEIQVSAYRKLDKPLIYYADATMAVMLEYYWKNQRLWIRREAERCEQVGIANASVCFMASDWAARSVVKDYGFPKERTHVIEFGANIDDEDIVRASSYDGQSLNILFSGVDWERKGGDVAVECVRMLNSGGVKAMLTIVGIRNLPASVACLPFVRNIGFFNKNVPEQYRLYVDTIKASHLLLLPTMAECAGIVYCEASAYGLPVFTRNTGGTANYCVDGVNGRNLKYGATPADFAEAISQSINGGLLSKYSEQGLRLYEEKLSWKAWSRRFAEIMNNYEKEGNLK